MSKGTKIFAIVGVVAIIGAGIFYFVSGTPAAPATQQRGVQ